MSNERTEAHETLYSSAFQPDPARAVDVLAFVLAPARAFIVNCDDPDEVIAVTELLREAKIEAISRWQDLQPAHRGQA